MRSFRHVHALLFMTSFFTLALAVSGCGETGARSGSRGPLGPRGPIRLDRGTPPSSGGRVPGGSGAPVPIRLDTGFFLLSGTPVPGSASLTSAMVWDPFASDMPPFGSGGTGAFDVTVDGTHYPVAGADAFVARFTDDDGDEYLVLSIFSDTPDGAGGYWESNVAVFVRASDFAPHATVALDGVDRVAIFAAGPDTAPDPTIFAAAVSGSVTFGDGTAATGGMLDATLDAEFARAEATAGPSGPTTGVPLVAGDYDLVIDPASPEILCGGTLEGHEAAFAAVTLAPLALVGGTVSLALPSESTLTISGPAVGPAFGDPALLDAVASPPDTYMAMTDLSDTGPDGTELAGAYVIVEGMPESAALAHAAIALAYLDPVGDGGCDAVFYAELRAR